MPHDLVIRGVVDGTGLPAVHADVAVDGNRIVDTGRVTARGHREIDATDLIVSRQQHRGGWQGSRLPEPPSAYHHRRVTTCSFRDRTRIVLLDRVGEDNARFECDYPHTDST